MRSRTGTLLMRPGLTQDPLDYPLDQLLAIHLLHQRGGLLLHAACLMHQGRTFVVAGPSGAGKTTLARAAAALPGVTVLTDERVVVRRHEGRWFADGTPWMGEGLFAHPASGPLAGIFILDKSNVDHVEQLSPVRAMAALLGCHFPAAWHANAQDQLKPVEELIAAVPAYRLQTRLGGVAHRLVVAGGQSYPGCLSAERGRGALIAELLRGGESAEFTAFGTSMTPAICPGDMITVTPLDADRAEVGDVVVFERHSQLVAHRVISLAPLKTQGDALTLPDENIEPTALIGRVARVGHAPRRYLRRRLFEMAQSVCLSFMGLVRRTSITSLALMLGAFVTSACSPASPDASFDPEAFIDDVDYRFVIVVNEDTDPQEVAARHGVEPFHIYDSSDRFRGFAAVLSDEMLADLESDPDVRGVNQDQVFKADDNYYYGLQRIEGDLNVANYSGEGVDVDIAILDTGIKVHWDYDVAGGFNSVASYNDPNAWDDDQCCWPTPQTYGHGTHVAGIAAAIMGNGSMAGVAAGARLWAVKVLDADGNGFATDIAAGLDWAVAQGIPVANLSLSAAGTVSGDCNTTTDVVYQAVCNAVANGTTVVVSAGNYHVDAAGYVPASFDEVITVAALSDWDGQPGGLASQACSSSQASAGGPDDTLAKFSNYGSDVDIIAPGVCIRSHGNDGYDYTVSGTSQAAPHVAGAAAIYLHHHPGATVAQVRAALLARGNPLVCNGTDSTCTSTYGTVDVPMVFLGHLDESFELANVNDVPSCVDTTSGDSSASVTASTADGLYDGGSQSLAIETASDTQDPDYTRIELCLPDDASTHFRASFSINFANLVDTNPMAIFGDGSPGEMLYWWWVDQNGSIDDDQQVGSVTTSNWHRITIEIDRSAGTSTFDVDGNGTTSLLTTWGSTPTTPMKCLAFTTWPDQLQSVFVDDVLVTSC